MPITKATTNVVNLDKDTTVNGIVIGTKGNASTTVVGLDALNSRTNGSSLTAFGYQALFSNTSGSSNVAVGPQALYFNTSGVDNIAVGFGSLQNNQTSSGNVAVGASALSSSSTGTYNTAIGYSALGSQTGYTNTTGVGNSAAVTGSNQVQLGNSSTTTYVYGTVQSRSDVRDKADVRDTQLGLDFVKSLRPVDFKWDMREDYRRPMPVNPGFDASEEEKAAYKVEIEKWMEESKLSNITHDGSKKRNRYHHGLIAQEVKAVLNDKGIDFGGYQDHSVKGGDDVLSIGYEELIAPMIKAIQELSAEVASLKAQLNP